MCVCERERRGRVEGEIERFSGNAPPLSLEDRSGEICRHFYSLLLHLPHDLINAQRARACRDMGGAHPSLTRCPTPVPAPSQSPRACFRMEGQPFRLEAAVAADRPFVTQSQVKGHGLSRATRTELLASLALHAPRICQPRRV